jgi:hypothetical protein
MGDHGAMSVIATKLQPRTVQVIVGPAGSTGLSFTQEDIAGTVKSYRGSKPNEASVTIHGLSEQTIAQLEAPNQVMQVLAGETVTGSVFIGSISRRGVVTKNSLPDRTTTISAKDGRRVYRDTKVSRSYPQNTPVATVVQDLLALATVQGLSLSPSNVYPTDSFPAGWAFQGRWRQALTEILAPRGFYWTIQSRVLYVLNEASTAPGNVPLVSPDTGLIGSPTRTDKGCSLVSVLNPGIVAGRGVQVRSQFFNGLYRAVNVTHNFSSDGLTWKTSVQAEVLK